MRKLLLIEFLFERLFSLDHKKLLVIAGMSFLALTGCSYFEKPEQWVLRGSIMGTSYTVKIMDPPGGLDLDLVEKSVMSTLTRIDVLMSTYKDDSEISRFNRFKENKWFTVSPDTLAVIQLSQEVSHLSRGSFDVTVAPLIEMWGFGKRVTGDSIPSDEKIQEALSRIGYQHLEINPDTSSIRKHRALTVNLSAVAKGYAVDKVVDQLNSLKLNSFLVEVGGEVWARGRKPDGKPWRIAVESPVFNARAIQRILDVSEVGIATSGDYRNYFEKDGVRYSHTIDPVTGKPVSHHLVSVTVVDPSTAKADAWATALLVKGPEEALALADQQNLSVFFITKDENGFSERMTRSFKRYISN